MSGLSIVKVGAQLCHVVDASAQHVGYLKWIQQQWKFKAIGYTAAGDVIPGGGPLTDCHNTVFPELDLVAINQALGRPGHDPEA
jgi:hypothetical protein